MAERHDKAKALMAKCGYGDGGSIGKMRDVPASGRMPEAKGTGAYSKPEGRKHGGSVKHKGATVNVVVAPQGAGAGGPMPHPVMPPPVGPAMSGPAMPMGAAPGMPPGLPPKPPGMMKRGGGVKMRADGGVASGASTNAPPADDNLTYALVKRDTSGKLAPPKSSLSGSPPASPEISAVMRRGPNGWLVPITGQMKKKGGGVKMNAGAGSGFGRIEKVKEYG